MKDINNIFLYRIGLNNDDHRSKVTRSLYDRLEGEKDEDISKKIERIMINIVANSDLGDLDVIWRYRGYFFINDISMNKFLKLLSIEGKVDAIMSAIIEKINMNMVYNYLGDNYTIICSNGILLWRLIDAIIVNNEEKILGEKSKEYPEILTLEFKVALTSNNIAIAEYFFKKIENSDIIRVRPEELDNIDLLKFLKELIRTGSINQEGLEKAYCWCLYSKDIGVRSLMSLLELNPGNFDLPIEYIFDCIIRRPDIRALKFYELLLRLILGRKNEFKLRKDVFIMINHLMKLIKSGDIVIQRIIDNSERISNLLGGIKEKNLTLRRCTT